MRNKKLSIIILLCAMSLAAFLNGCGSSSKEGRVLGTLDKVDEATCRTCHVASLEAITGESILAQFNNSPHVANGCQSCHGGGAMHKGVGPMPFPKPGPDQCNVCHTDNDSKDYANSGHANVATEDGEAKCNRCHTHEGAILGMKSGFTGDKNVMDAMAGAPGVIANASVIQCSTCHVMHEGKLRTDAGWNPAAKVGSAAASTSKEYSLCTGCHTYINEDGQLVASGTAASGTASFFHNTAWNRVIASTHYDNPATGVGLESTKIEGYVIRTNTANPCFDCHGHEAKTNTNILARQTVNGVTGYVRANPEATIYTDWAKSAHAGKLLAQKYAAVDDFPKKADGTYNRTAGMLDAVMAAGVDGNTGAGWEHYDWDSTSRQSCQRCHTSTGLVAFLTATKNKTTYNAANNDFSHLSGWTTANKTSPQNELLYCWGCHSNAGTGELRAPGAITEKYAAGTAGDPATTIAYPDAGNSNVCMTCHLGREVGDVIKNDQDADGTRSFINSHYLTAGGTVFGKTGYTLFGRDYNSTAKGFVHDKLGISATGTAAADAYIASNNLSTSGPCVVCHMTSEKAGVKTSHSYSPYSEYTAGDVSLNPVCVTCHDSRGAGTNAKASWFAGTWKKRSDAALEALKVQLDAKGVYFANENPYFFKDSNGNGVLDPAEIARDNAFTNWAGVNGFAEWKNVMGVAFNYNLLEHDPGAVAHNRYYVRRLVYDSLDYLDDYTANYSVFASLNALPDATTYKADAITFLINRGTADANVGTAAERY